MTVGGIMVVESSWSEQQIDKAVAWVRKLPEVRNPAGYLLSLAKTGRDPNGFVPPTHEERVAQHEAEQRTDNAFGCWERDRQPCSRNYSWCSVCSFGDRESPPRGEQDETTIQTPPRQDNQPALQPVHRPGHRPWKFTGTAELTQAATGHGEEARDETP